MPDPAAQAFSYLCQRDDMGTFHYISDCKENMGISFVLRFALCCLCHSCWKTQSQCSLTAQRLVGSWLLEEVLWCLFIWVLTFQSLRVSFWGLTMALTHLTVLGLCFEWQKPTWSRFCWKQKTVIKCNQCLFQLQAFILMTPCWKGSHKLPGSTTPSSLDPSTPYARPPTSIWMMQIHESHSI